MQFCHATEDTLDDLVDLGRIVRGEIPNLRGQMRKRLETFPDGFYVCLVDRKVVGYANSIKLAVTGEILNAVEENFERTVDWIELHNDEGNLLILYGSAVHPDFRRKSVWRGLLKKRIEYAKNYGTIKAVFTSGRKENNNFGPATGLLLEKMGFEVVGEFINCVGVECLLLRSQPPYDLNI